MRKCPRCKKLTLFWEKAMNSLSRRASIYICNDCGNDEALIDSGDMEPDEREKKFVETYKK